MNTNVHCRSIRFRSCYFINMYNIFFPVDTHNTSSVAFIVASCNYDFIVNSKKSKLRLQNKWIKSIRKDYSS